MLIFENIKPNLLYSSCIALGFFDGVHLGHEKVILDAVNRSKKIDAISAVVTFSNHPQSVISGRHPKLLTTLDKRIELFEELGAQAVILLKFTEEIAGLPPENYLKSILIESLNPKSISIGYNHHFGAQKKGNGAFLKEFESKYNYKLSVIPPVSIDNHVVNSSSVRKLIKTGDVKTAARLLGRLFTIKNTVIHGEKRGRAIGFPTANLTLPHNFITPHPGVYSGLVTYEDKTYRAVINVGKRPTFGDLAEDLLEVHILDFNQDIYGQQLEVSFIEKLRDEVKFDSVDALKKQIQSDCVTSLESNVVF